MPSAFVTYMRVSVRKKIALMINFDMVEFNYGN